MTLQILILILLWTFIILFTVALLFVTFIIGKASVKDNSKEAWVFIKTGLHIAKPAKAVISESSGKGQSFGYKSKVVMIPKTYQEIYHRGKRMIFLSKAGQIIASPFSDDNSISDEEKENLIYEMCASHIGADGMRALKGKQTLNILIIAVISLIIGAIAMFGIVKFQEFSSQNTLQSTPQTEPKAGQEISPPVKVK